MKYYYSLQYISMKMHFKQLNKSVLTGARRWDIYRQEKKTGNK